MLIFRFTLILLTCFLFQTCTESTAENFSDTTPVIDGSNVEIFTTADSSNLRLTPMPGATFAPAPQPLETEIAIFVNPNKKFQTLLGIGGAITDASAEVFATLPTEQQDRFLQAYFDPVVGIGYTLTRTTIHSCDFSKESYTYVSDDDPQLSTFNIERDTRYRIPLIKRAIATAGGELPLYVSPWSPPSFMKTNNQMLQGGKLRKEFYPAWSSYFVKFIQAYEAQDIPIWGLTIQNEPMATQRWESCIYSAEEERDFLKLHLGPDLEAAGLGDKKIVVWDHNRDLINHRVSTILEDPVAAKYVWGVGFHWYETWTGGEPMFSNLGQINESYPEVNLIFTEGCNERFDISRYQYWPNAERYGRSMINDFNQGTVAWTDWNILLDQHGGPNHVGNFCFAPVHADTDQGNLIFTPSYYYIGHFSKFIRPGARRVSTVSSRSHLLATSFQNKDGEMVTVVMNPTDDAITYKLQIFTEAVTQTIPAHGMQTLRYSL